MIVVSDTSSLNYLILIGQDRVLPQLFGQVYAPPAVIAEMQHPRTPQEVLRWINNPPVWLVVQTPANVSPIARLGRGETEAISLAQELRADLILIDERKGVVAAERLGLPVIGTLNVLRQASRAGLLNLPAAVAALKQTNFRWSQKLIDRILHDDLP